MGQTVSIHDLEPIPKQQRKSTISRSHSSSTHSLSQLSHMTATSTISSSTVSISDKFVSYENTVIDLPCSPYGSKSASMSDSGSNRQQKPVPRVIKYKLRIKRKDDEYQAGNSPTCASTTSSSSTSTSSFTPSRSIVVVFGVCDKSVLNEGYRHKYYGYGYSVTYCHGYKLHSFATQFQLTDEIVVHYDTSNGQISFSANGVNKSQCIRVNKVAHNVITIKPYDDMYDVVVQQE